MLVNHFVGDAIRVAVVLALALAVMPLLRRTSSAARRLVLAASLGGALVLPLVSAAVPAWRVRTPEAVLSVRAVLIGDPLVPASAPAKVVSAGVPAAPSPLRAGSARPFDPTTLIVSLW